MKRAFSKIPVFLLCCILQLCPAFEGLPEPLIGCAEVRAAEDADRGSKSYPGFTLIPQAGNAKIVLVDMSGKVVRTWPYDAQRARLLPNCNLLVLHGSKWGIKRKPWKGLRNKVREYDWSGKVVWEYDAPNVAHHDLQRQPNGNTIFIHRTAVPSDNREAVIDPVRKIAKIRSDVILEVNPAKEIVWQWRYHDNFDLNSCGRRSCRKLPAHFKQQKKFVDWTHTNTVAPLPENKWFDQGHRQFKPGNLVVMPRNWSQAYIIDRESKKVVWQYGGDYKGGLSGPHEAHMIEKGLPGAGNILIFDNGHFDNGRQEVNQSSFILEINPLTKKPVWIYDAGRAFFSAAAGSVQRLPNGNTLISEDVPGRIFEVTPEKQIVWQYQSELRTCRAHRYSYDYCSELSKLHSAAESE